MKNKIFISLFMVFTLLSVINPLSNIFGVRYTNELSYNYNDIINMSSDEFYLFAEECRDFIKNKEGVELNYYIGYNAGTVGSTVPQYYLIFSNNPILVSLDSNNLRYTYTLNKSYIFRFYDTLNFPTYSNNLLDTSDGYKYYNRADAWCDSTNPFIMSDHDIYLVNDACDGPSDTIFNPKNVIPDDTIGDPRSDLQLSYQYNEDNTSCHIDATLKGGEFTDQIYYSNYQFDLEGKLKTKKPFPKAGIDITENQALYFQAEDKDGNIKAKNTMNIYGIGKLDPNNFIVNIDTSSQSAVIFSAKLLNDGYIYNSINCKISDTENLGILKGLSYMTSDFKEYNEIGQNEEYKIKNFSNDRKKITLYFQIKNKVTGKVMLTKSYDIDLKSTITESDFSTIDSGIINEGQDDEQIMTPDNDPNFGKNNGSLDFDWNFDTAKNSIEEFFTTAKEMFNLIINFLNQLPKWITIPLYTLFMMAIIIFVFHVIRG